MFVISILRTKDYIGRPYTDERKIWEYACYDDHAGSLSTGYPIFDNIRFAKFFGSIDEAKKWFELNKSCISFTNYDKNTLAIRKVVFKKEISL